MHHSPCQQMRVHATRRRDPQRPTQVLSYFRRSQAGEGVT